MSNTLDEIDLLRLLPEALRSMPDVQFLMQAINDVMQARWSVIQSVMMSDTLPAQALDVMAWEKHVDYYDASLTLEQKRAIIDASDRAHQVKGTPAAVEEVVKAVYDDAKVTEWYEYGGQPGRYRIETARAIKTADEINRLGRLISSTTRLSSELEGMSFNKQLSAGQYVGVALFITKTIDISAT